jgi:hypothetical protein
MAKASLLSFLNDPRRALQSQIDQVKLWYET